MQKNEMKLGVLVGAALAGIFAGTSTSAMAAELGQGDSSRHTAGISARLLGADSNSCNGKDGCKAADQAGRHSCKGMNACKGQGGCKSSDNGCKGKNSCKGKGGCATTSKPAEKSGSKSAS